MRREIKNPELLTTQVRFSTEQSTLLTYIVLKKIYIYYAVLRGRELTTVSYELCAHASVICHKFF
jgi:hypothetical protein